MWNPVWTWTTTTYTFDFETLFCGVFFLSFRKNCHFSQYSFTFFQRFLYQNFFLYSNCRVYTFFSNFGIHWTTKPTYCASTTSSKCKCCHKSRFSNIFFRFFLYFFSVKNSEYCLVGDIMPSPSVAHWLSLIVSVENFQKVQY